MDDGPPVAFYVASLLGTFRRPKLTNITTGMFTGQSLVFHTQEGQKYVEYDKQMYPDGIFQEYTRKVCLITSTKVM